MPPEKPSEKRQRFIAQGALDAAPTANKARYLKIPDDVANKYKIKLFEPAKGNSYKVVFIPWKAGKYNTTARKKGDWVCNTFFGCHRHIGPEEDHHLCVARRGKTCAVCDEFNVLRSRGVRGDKDYFKNILQPLKAKDRELMLLHILKDDDKKNLYLWDESVHLFGGGFRDTYRKRSKWMAFADLEEGCVVEFEAKEKKIESGSCIDMSQGIIIDPREQPLANWLIEAAETLCPDDWLAETPYTKLKGLFRNTGGAEEEEEELVAEDKEDEPKPEPKEEEEEKKPSAPAKPKPTPKKEEKKPSAPAKPKPTEEDEEDEDEEDEDEEDEDEDEEDEDEEDEDDEDEGEPDSEPEPEDDEEKAPRRRGKK